MPDFAGQGPASLANVPPRIAENLCHFVKGGAVLEAPWRHLESRAQHRFPAYLLAFGGGRGYAGGSIGSRVWLTGTHQMGRLFAAISVMALLAACGPAPGLELAVRYCYRTLAEVDCHAQPLPGEDGRRVGFFDEAALR